MTKKGTTNNGLPAFNSVKDEDVDFDLDPHLISLIWHEPFFSDIMKYINKKKTTDIPTAGVTVVDGTIQFYYNPNFLASLEANQIRGLIKHECYHLIFKHTTTRRHNPHLIWNYATDLAINSIIREDELPEGGLIPGKHFKKPDADVWKKMTKEQKERFELISNAIAAMPKRKSSEWYFSELNKNKELTDAIQKDNGKIIIKVGKPGSGDGEGNIEVDISGMDDHEGWDDLSDEDKAFAKAKIEQALGEAVKKADSSNSWGSIGQETRRELRDMISKEVDWRSLLRNFCGRRQRAEKSSSIKKINRKYPYIHAGRKRKHTSNIAVYVDMSGSVCDASLELLYGELASLSKRTTFTFFPFDHGIDDENAFVWKRKSKIEAKRYRSGGTCFKTVAKHANDRRGQFDAYIIMTDGYAPLPQKTLLKRAWIITPDGDQSFSCDNDIIIKIKG